MIVNLKKIQTIVVKKNAKMKDSYSLNISDLTIKSENREKTPLRKKKFFLIVLYTQTLIVVAFS